MQTISRLDRRLSYGAIHTCAFGNYLRKQLICHFLSISYTQVQGKIDTRDAFKFIGTQVVSTVFFLFRIELTRMRLRKVLNKSQCQGK